MKHHWILMFPALFGLIGGCAKQQPGATDELLAKLRQRMGEPVSSEQRLSEHNALVKKVVDEDAFGDMRRHEIANRIGKGSPCAAHPDCMNRGFESDDWVYIVGEQPDTGVTTLPMLIIGFDREGHHARSHYVIKE